MLPHTDDRYGVALTGTVRDIAALHTLADAAPELISAPWEAVEAGAGDVVCTPALADADLRQRLADRGVPVVPMPPGDRRSSPHLAEALRPVRLSGDPEADLAWFVVPTAGSAAATLLERLLLLGRDDVEVAVVDMGDPALIVRVSNPPAYLLMRSRDEGGEVVRAYAAQGASGRILVAWGFAHPLIDVAEAVADRHGSAILVDATGQWRTAPADLAFRSVYDVLDPILEAARHDLQLAEDADAHRFTLHMRLGPGPELDPELWLISAEAFAGLESFIEATPPDQLRGLTVCRLEVPDRSGVCYLLRERVRPGAPRLGAVLCDVLESSGFALAEGTDNLYLPTRRRLLPTMRRDDLRGMLALDQAKIVLIDEGSHGPVVKRIAELREEPLSQFVDLVALDHRVELDRMLDDALFQFPRLDLEPRPSLERSTAAPAPPAKRDKRPRRAERPKPEQRAAVEAAEAEEDLAARSDADRALRERARAYEAAAAEGGFVDGEAWAVLGDLKVAVDDLDDAGICYEAALFYAPDDQVPGWLQTQRARLAGTEMAAREIADLALIEPPAAGPVALLGARIVALLAKGGVPADGVLQHVVAMFSDPKLPCSRRLAWSVLRAVHAATDDKLGLTRAKEAIVGGMNANGLDPTYDVPRFVRQVIALGDDVPELRTVVAADQAGALDDVSRGVPMHEFDVLSAFARVIFASGYVRLGAVGRARELVAPVEAELAVHDRPNRVLLQLYIAKMGIPSDDPEQWAAEYERLVQRENNETQRVVAWFCKRSGWLAAAQDEPEKTWIRRPLQARIDAFDAEPASVPQALQRALEEPSHYDYELAYAITEGFAVATATGREALMAAAVAAVEARLDRLGSPGYRARAIGACIGASAMSGSTDGVIDLLDRIVDIAEAPGLMSIRELLTAVRPALLALRRLGNEDAAGGFLRGLQPLATADPHRAATLCALLAEGFLQLKDRDASDSLMQLAMQATLDPDLDDYAARDASGREVLAALKHWPLRERVPYCRKLIANLEVFRDAFTARRYFGTYQLLLLERLVDTVVDSAIVGNDRIRSFLDTEELAIRRQIHADWDERCGR